MNGKAHCIAYWDKSRDDMDGYAEFLTAIVQRLMGKLVLYEYLKKNRERKDWCQFFGNEIIFDKETLCIL